MHAGSEEARERRRAVPAHAGIYDVVLEARLVREIGPADPDPLPAASWAAVPVVMFSLVHRSLLI
jgi:hypothetical protein